MVIVGAAWASRAALGSLLRRRCKILVVNIRAPAGWMMVFVGNWTGASSDGAFGSRRVTFAPVSTSAVVRISGGLVQPDSEKIVLAKLSLTSYSHIC